MNRRFSNTPFYIEAVLLLLIAAGLLTAVTGVFALARNRSRHAAELTAAVLLAQNACEAAAGAQSADDLAARLDAAGTASRLDADGLSVRYAEDLTPDPAGPLCLRLGWTDGPLVRITAAVVNAAGTELYTLETAVEKGEVGP